MRNQRVKALSISRPVFDMMKREYLAGRVLANYPSTGSGHRRRACNLLTSEGAIIALVGPAIGNGPLNIVLEETGVLEHVKPGLLAVFSDAQFILGDSLVVSLDGAQLWRPEVDWGRLATQPRRLERNLAALCSWLSQNDISQSAPAGSPDPAAWRRIAKSAASTCDLLSLVLDEKKGPGAREDGTRSPQDRAFLTMVRAGIKGLMQSLQDGDRSGIRENATLLAGLGPGLTPAGDDYLVGLMAGLRVWPGSCGVSPEEACPIILEATEGRTTLLSRAFLRSAKQGLFGENWHELLAALARGDAIGIQRAARRILSSGATSGADALAGFLSPYLWHRSGDFSRAGIVVTTSVALIRETAEFALEEQLAHHHQVDDQRAAALEIEHQHLAPPPYPYDSSTLHGFPELDNGELALRLLKNATPFHPPPDGLASQLLF